MKPLEITQEWVETANGRERIIRNVNVFFYDYVNTGLDAAYNFLSDI